MKWTGRDAAEDWFDQRMGFFRAYDTLANHSRQYLVTTHFEPSGARSTFPCWDEPGFKAQFEISVKHSQNYIALSNMPEKSHQELQDGRVITHFERSLVMSPYLPCVAVANYKSIKNAHGNITFYGLESNLESLRFALEVSEKVIPAMEAYTGMPYAMPKLDQICIPQYTGAMEHWGLVSYLTSMVKLENTTLIPNVEKKDRIIFLVAHELAHQWFGNLVSPVWWDDTWLNEGFAAYFQSKIIDQIYPHWRVMDYFVIEDVNHESYDAETVIPEVKPIKWSPHEKISLRRIFNPVTYRKGAAVIHMLEHILTEDVFRKGLQRYLKAHQFTAVVTDDLWKAFQEAYNEQYGDKPLDIKEMMDPWLEQTGTPIVTVTRNYETGETNLTQKNFRVTPDNTWKIPINYATKSNPDFSRTAPTMWMEYNEKEITLPDINKDDWIILNIQQRGFYRVNYDRENWQRIAEYLNSDDYDKIHPVNRAQLLDDIYRIYQDDNSYLDVLVNITSYLHRETDYLPWVPAGNIILDMISKLNNSPEEELFEMYMLFLTNKTMDKLGFEDREGEDHLALRVRSILAPMVCRFGHTDCRSFAYRLFIKYLENPAENTLPSSDWAWIMCAGLRKSNNTMREKFLTAELKTDSDDWSQVTLFIQCTNDTQLRDDYITSLLKSNSTTDVEEIDSIFDHLLDSKLGDVNYALNYMTNNFKEIKKFYDESDDDSYLVPISRLSLAVRTNDQIEKFKTFIENIIPDLKGQSEWEISYLRTSLTESVDASNKAKLNSAKFHELLDQKIIDLNVVEIGKALKNKA
ncbi:aminopeptidase N-like [Microplitis demolitor]|uniref:aminopeptidase N-like n=1 Tax=Microplitis demolitor TaxID=69319 RepID=UPI0006D525D0|nr:aminopeptidase N-like [Microplitis demolitor]